MDVVLLGIVVVALTVYALADLVNTPDRELRHLSLTAWAVMVLFVPVLGPLAWLSIGRGEVRRLYRPRTPGFELTDAAAERPPRFPRPRRPVDPPADRGPEPDSAGSRADGPPSGPPLGIPDPWGDPLAPTALPAVDGLDPDDPEDRWLLEQIARQRRDEAAAPRTPEPVSRRDPGPSHASG